MAEDQRRRLDDGTPLHDIDLTDLDRFCAGFPHETFAQLRRAAPVWWHEPTPHTPGGEGFWVLSRYAEVAAAAADAATFASDGSAVRAAVGRGAGGGTLIEDLPAGFAAGVLLNMCDEPRHQQVRRLFTPSVSPRALAAMEDDLRARAVALVDEVVAHGGECDLLTDVAAELPLQAVAELLGVPQHDRHRLLAWADATLDYDDRDLGEQGARAAAASAEMFEYGTALLAEKRRCPAGDLLSIVATSDMAELEQQMVVNLLIAAGSETTRNTIAIGVLALLERPDQWEALRRDRTLVPGAVEEMLRWASSTTYNRRTATRDTELAGVPIAAGDKVTLWWGSANHDDAVFPSPRTFDIRRDPNRHLAFGHGSHFCLGAALARMEIRLVLDALLDRVVGGGSTAPPEWVRSNKHTGLRHAPVRFELAVGAGSGRG